MLSRPDPTDFPDTPRLEIRRRLGAGSFGIVYEGWDRERQSPVALKWLSSTDAETIHRFKNEFRSLAEISHPNLVQLYDLSCEGERWFFTMELVQGLVLPHYLRPDVLPAAPGRAGISGTILRGAREEGGSPSAAAFGACDVPLDEVRAVFSQLARGVHALHEAGKLHRDLKCQNVMVTDAGRVVLLDFGLVREVDASSVTEELDIAGTPLYMAPEQCRGEPIDRAADWYAVGVMLFRALTDRFPFDGRMHEVIQEKQTRDAPAVLDIVPGAPSDLAGLANRLLARRPEDRPTGPEVLAVLGVGDGPSVAYPPPPAETFVGRHRELAILRDARAALEREGPTAIYVHGASGIGKTALVRHFLDEVRRSSPDTLVLEGRCFQRERLPYKALDRIVDSLTLALRRLPPARCAELVPAHVQDLVRVFPAFGRVPSFREAAEPGSAALDPQEQRRGAIESFGDLFRRLARRHDVVVFVDDLQWGDRDSALLVAPLLEAAGTPLLWIGTFRSDEAAASPFLEYLGVLQGRPQHTLLDLSELDESEARALLEVRLGDDGRDVALVERLAREAAGTPLFIDLLVRAQSRTEHAVETVDLAAVIDERMEGLAPELRRLLSTLAVRARPLERTLAAEVVGELDFTALTQLRNGRLIRIREGEGEELELYHDRIRETVVARLAADEERAIHAGLARALHQRGADPESLAYHHRGAGQLPEAFRFTLDAARHAEKALAFERAAELYRSASELAGELPDEVDGVELRIAEADALRNAGRGADAARAYLRAAGSKPRDAALELRRLAGEQYLMSGHLDEGRAVLRGVLRELDISLPEHPVRAFAEFLLRRAQVRLRGLAFTEREGELSPEEQRRIDACWGMAVGLAMVDPVRGGIFQALHLLAALDAGQPKRVARAIAVEIPFCATPGMPNRRRTAELERLGRELAERADDDFTSGLLAESIGGAAWLEGRWYDALEYEERGIAIHRRSGGASWEMTTGTIVLLDVLWRMGRWRELHERYPAVLADATSRGDLLLETYTRIKFRSHSRLAADDPDAAIQVARDAVGRWSQTAFTLLQLWKLFVHVEAQLYAGRAELARERLEASWPALKRSQLLRLQMYDVTMRDLAGRVALACAARASNQRRAKLLAEAEATARYLERAGAPWALGPATALLAGIAASRGERRRARARLERAEERFRASAMELHAQVMRARRAELAGESSGGIREALGDLGLARPDRWIALLAPGRWDAS